MAAPGSVLEAACFLLLLAYLAWVPMPFGSASDAAMMPLVLPPMILAAAALLIPRRPPIRLTRTGRLWSLGAALFVAVHALQLVPLPQPLLRAVSPESARLWSNAGRVAALAGVQGSAMHPISVDPAATAVQLFYVAAYAATFVAGMLLFRTKQRRMVLAALLTATAVFETVYAAREAALERYAIWGWKNTLIYNRATGTFVNPNHFAHYAAIILPLSVFIGAFAWHTASPPAAPLRRRIVMLIERRIALFGFGAIGALACLAAILIAQSRGAALATIAGFSAAGALASGRRHAVTRAALIALALAAAFAGVLLLLGQRSQHLQEDASTSLEGRRSSVVAALRIWREFPLFGSGAGTYEAIWPHTQERAGELIANHAHNDYAETLATTGAVGFIIAFVPLLGGLAALARSAFGRAAAAQASWRRRAFYAAALTSIAVAMVHALLDFNFYIPANPVTLAAIAGAAAAIREPASR